ncbi:MAG: glucose-6-phosphate isomerase [Deltaproteobacteria bacterium]|nr:MAG: glucose-6-phosphate isomerase [Deltaproteobacteria bacterium]
MALPDDAVARHSDAISRAFADLEALESGAIVNPDEGRQVGHYWLRAPELAPSEEQTRAIRATRFELERFVESLHGRFSTVLCVGIGGSALGPQLVADALGTSADRRRVVFADNTDPDGIARVLDGLDDLADTLVVVTSKSGGTPETRNGMLLVAEAFAEAGLDLSRQAVAITGEGSALDRHAEGWLARFPMWNWVGGRTSVMSAVGLLPAYLQGLDVDAFLEGARLMDEHTRVPVVEENPAMLLALSWWEAAAGKGERAMVVLPYKDRLVLFSKYLQQLVMESLGKQFDRAGHEVHQGLVVYGNKGSTDQHAYVQQLREGPDDFFVTFVEVLEDGGSPLEVSPGARAGDYLSGFLAGTRQALHDAGRSSITLTVPRVDATHLGALIALYERAVAFYASLVDINPYHQPGVEAGKKAAATVLALQDRVLGLLDTGASGNAERLAEHLEADSKAVFHILRHLAANGRVRVHGEGLHRVFEGAD